jgi:class 3 adenylate cyclase
MNLVELGILTEEQIARCLSEHNGLPFCGADAVANVSAQTVARLSREVADQFRCVPLYVEGGVLWIGIADQATLADLSELSAAVGSPVSLAFVTELALNYALDRYYGIRREVRGLQLAAVVDAYRWLSNASSRMSACNTVGELVALVGEVLSERFAPDHCDVLWVERDSLVSHDETLPIPSDLPVEALRGSTRPLVVDDTMLCSIRDDQKWRAVITMRGVTPGYGDLELVQVLLESTAHTIGLVETRATAHQGERLAKSLGRYVSDRVVEELKRDEELVLFGRKHEVSVLFVDIRGFTTLSEQLDPDVTVLVLNIFFGEMSAAVGEHAGTIDKFIGDGLMAFWGAPAPVPDHATLAARAALQMQARMPRVNRKVRRLQIDDLQPLTIGIGVCTGVVLVGNMGTPQLMQYTAIGDVVNVAARLCGTALGGEILVDDKTAALVDPDILPVPRGPLVVKGRGEPVLVHSIVPR